MCEYRVYQHLIVPNLYVILINEVLDTKFITVQITESKFNAKNVNAVKLTT